MLRRTGTGQRECVLRSRRGGQGGGSQRLRLRFSPRSGASLLRVSPGARAASSGRVGFILAPSWLLIFACAAINGLDLAHDDTHFDELAKLEA